MPFTDWWSAAEKVVLLEGSPISTDGDYWVLGHLPEQGPSPPIAQFGRAASSRNSLGGSKLLPFKNDGGHCYWVPSMLQTFFGTLSQI